MGSYISSKNQKKFDKELEALMAEEKDVPDKIEVPHSAVVRALSTGDKLELRFLIDFVNDDDVYKLTRRLGYGGSSS